MNKSKVLAVIVGVFCTLGLSIKMVVRATYDNTYLDMEFQLFILFMFFGLWLIYHLVVFVHELGHLCVAKMLGYSSMLFVSGPVVVVYKNKRQHMHLRQSGLLFWGGCVLLRICQQVNSDSGLAQLRKDYPKIILGGIISSGAFLFCITLVGLLSGSVYVIIVCLISVLIDAGIFAGLFSCTGNISGDACLYKDICTQQKEILDVVHNNLVYEYQEAKYLAEKTMESLEAKCSVEKRPHYNNLLLLEGILLYSILTKTVLSLKVEELCEGICNNPTDYLYEITIRNTVIIKLIYNWSIYNLVVKKSDSWVYIDQIISMEYACVGLADYCESYKKSIISIKNYLDGKDEHINYVYDLDEFMERYPEHQFVTSQMCTVIKRCKT